MKKEKILSLVAKIYGALITSFLIAVFAPKLFGSLHAMSQIPEALIQWNDDPTGFFFTYLLGYALLWRRPLTGTLIIFFAGVLFFLINSNNKPFLLLFILPSFAVAILYLWHSSTAGRNSSL